MTHRQIKSRFGAVAMAASCGWMATASAATFPFSEDFEGATVPGDTEFVTSGANATWSIEDTNATFVSKALRLQFDPSTSQNAFALAEVTGVPTSFTARTDMVINDVAENPGPGHSYNATPGLLLLAGSDAGTSPALLLTVSIQGFGGNTPGQMQIIGLGTGGGGGNETVATALFNDSSSPLLENVVYTLSANVADNGSGGLTVQFTVSQDGGPSTTISGDVTVAPMGDFFGIRHRTAQGIFGQGGPFDASSDVSFDNFAVNVIPEPATLALIGVGGLLAAGRRRSGV